jgi:hypothetical protein
VSSVTELVDRDVGAAIRSELAQNPRRAVPLVRKLLRDYPDLLRRHRLGPARPGRPTGSRSLPARRADAIAFAFDKCLGLRPAAFLRAIGRDPTRANFNWLKRQLDLGRRSLNDPGLAWYIDDVFWKPLNRLPSTEQRRFLLDLIARLDRAARSQRP